MAGGMPTAVRVGMGNYGMHAPRMTLLHLPGQRPGHQNRKRRTRNPKRPTGNAREYPQPLHSLTVAYALGDTLRRNGASVNVPKVSEFFGISIYFYYEDHAPPHFHARCAGSDAMFTIDTVALLEGGLQRIAERRVQE